MVLETFFSIMNIDGIMLGLWHNSKFFTEIEHVGKFAERFIETDLEEMIEFMVNKMIKLEVAKAVILDKQ